MKKRNLKITSSKNKVGNPLRVGNLLLLETIAIKNKTLLNLKYHNERLNNSRKFLLGEINPINIRDEVVIPSDINENTYKCRIVYSHKIEKIEIQEYHLRPVRSLKIVEADHLNYDYKLKDRKPIEILFNKRGACDDILIIKNGHVTDTSYANIIFWNGESWITPSTPLLNGTKRQKLLQEGIIKEEAVSVDNLSKFSKARLVNALIYPEDCPNIHMDFIIHCQ
jgi:4-amino-4-deoxychorismate lyase